MNIPDELVFEILKYMNYDEISKLRLVNRRFNILCGSALNFGFKAVMAFHKQCFKEIKEALPRRDSERRKHHLFPRHDVLHAIETRLSMLAMTYSKYMLDGSTCFIPGKVLDELYKILHIIKYRDTPLINSLQLLQEIRDISSMAMEHFVEVIMPGSLKSRPQALQWFEHADPGVSTDNNSSKDPDKSEYVNKTIQNLNRLRRHDRKTVNELKSTVSKQSRKMQSFNSKVEDLTNANRNLMQTMQEMKGQLSEMAQQMNTLQGFLEVNGAATNASIPGTSGTLCISSSHLLDENSNVVRPRTVKKRSYSDESLEDGCDQSKRPR